MMADIEITEDLILHIPDREYFGAAEVDLPGDLLIRRVGRLVIDFGDGRLPCLIPEKHVRCQLDEPPLRHPFAYRVRATQALVARGRTFEVGDIVEVPGAMYGPGTFWVPQWVANHLDELTDKHLQDLRAERLAREHEAREQERLRDQLRRQAQQTQNRQQRAKAQRDEPVPTEPVPTKPQSSMLFDELPTQRRPKK